MRNRPRDPQPMHRFFERVKFDEVVEAVRSDEFFDHVFFLDAVRFSKMDDQSEVFAQQTVDKFVELQNRPLGQIDPALPRKNGSDRNQQFAAQPIHPRRIDRRRVDLRVVKKPRQKMADGRITRNWNRVRRREVQKGADVRRMMRLHGDRETGVAHGMDDWTLLNEKGTNSSPKIAPDTFRFLIIIRNGFFSKKKEAFGH